MIRDDDDVQMRALAAAAELAEDRRIARRQARVVLARDVAAHLVLFALAAAVLATVILAWAATGDERFGWAFVLIGYGIVVGYMSGLRSPR